MTHRNVWCIQVFLLNTVWLSGYLWSFFVKFVSPRYEFRSRYDLAPSAHSWILIKRFKIFHRMIWLCNIQRFCLQTRQFIMFIDEVYQPVIATAPYSVARLGQPPNHLSVLMSFNSKQTRFVLINICFRWIYCCSLLFSFVPATRRAFELIVVNIAKSQLRNNSVVVGMRESRQGFLLHTHCKKMFTTIQSAQ